MNHPDIMHWVMNRMGLWRPEWINEKLKEIEMNVLRFALFVDLNKFMLFDVAESVLIQNEWNRWAYEETEDVVDVTLNIFEVNAALVTKIKKMTVELDKIDDAFGFVDEICDTPDVIRFDAIVTFTKSTLILRGFTSIVDDVLNMWTEKLNVGLWCRWFMLVINVVI